MTYETNTTRRAPHPQLRRGRLALSLPPRLFSRRAAFGLLFSARIAGLGRASWRLALGAWFGRWTLRGRRGHGRSNDRCRSRCARRRRRRSGGTRHDRRWRILYASRHSGRRSCRRRPWGRVVRQWRADGRRGLAADRCWHVCRRCRLVHRARGRRIIDGCWRGGDGRGSRRVVTVCGSVRSRSNDDGARAERHEQRYCAERSKTHKTVGHT